MKADWYSMIERTDNFYLDDRFSVDGAEDLFLELYFEKESIFAVLKERHDVKLDELLYSAFLGIFRFMERYIPANLFAEEILPDIYEASYYCVLNSFLHHTKRSTGMSLQKFVNKNSQTAQKIKEGKLTIECEADVLKQEESTLRKTKNRITSARDFQHNNHKSGRDAIQKDTEHEWTLYFRLNWDAEDTVENEWIAEMHDTYKRIGNLYTVNYTIKCNTLEK